MLPAAGAATPAFTIANNLFAATTLGQAKTQNVTVTLNTAVALKSIALQLGFTEYKLGAISGCTVDGATVNAAGTVCTIPVTFTPIATGSTASAATARTAPLLVTDIESAKPVVYAFGLLGAATGPVMQFTPATLTRVAGAPATGYPTGDQGLGVVSSGYAGDNGLATAATFSFLNIFSVYDEPAQSMAVDSAGNIFVIDLSNQIIRHIDGTTNIVTTVVGTPKTYSRTGDGGPATSATIEEPASLALDAADNIYFSDAGTASTDGGFTIRMVNAGTGIVNSIAGQNLVLPYAGTGTCVESGQSYTWEPTCGDGGLATDAFIYNPLAIAIDGAGNIYILEEQGTIRRIDAVTGIITSIGNAVPSGVGEAFGMTMGADGNLYSAVDDADNPGEYLTQTDPGTGKTKIAVGGATAANNATCSEQGTPATEWFLGFTSSYTNGLSADGAGNVYGATGLCGVEGQGEVSFRYNIASGLAYAFTSGTGGGSGGNNGTYTSFGGYYGIQPALSIADGAGNIYFQTYNQIALLHGSQGSLGGFDSRYDYQTDAAGTICGQYYGDFCEKAVIVNVGNAPLDTSFVLSSGFTFLTNGDSAACVAGTLSPGDFCNLDIEFTPVTAGTVNGTLTLTDNATLQSDGQQVLALEGTGVAAPLISFSPATITFSNQLINTTSASQTVTISNPGTGPNTLDGIYLSAIASGFGLFNITGGTCPMPSGTLASGTSCTVLIDFAPTATGTFTDTLNVNNEVGSGTLTATVFTGTAIASTAPVATLAPTSLAFGNQAGNTTSAPQTLTLSNTGNAPLTGIAISITQNSGNVKRQIRPNGITIASSADFAATTTCGTTLAAGSSCTIAVTFSPIAQGLIQGTLSVSDSASNSPQTAALSGTGTTPAVPVATLTPNSLSFGNQVVNTSSASQTLTLSNSGNAPLLGIQISLNESNGDQARRIRRNGVSIAPSNNYSATTTCGDTLDVGSSCTIAVTFTPTSQGLIQGTLLVQDNASNDPQSASLSGTGTAPAAPVATLAPTSLSFGNQAVNSSSTPQTLTLSNSGNADLTTVQIFLSENNGDEARKIRLNGISVASSTNFSATTTCGSTLAAGSSCTIAVIFAPTTQGLIQGTLSVTDDASASPQTASLSGTGLTQPVFVSPVGTMEAAQTVTVNLTDDGGLGTIQVLTGGTANLDFTLASGGTCTIGTAYAGGETCTVNVVFKPRYPGARIGAVNLIDNQGFLLGTTFLPGTGIGPEIAFGPGTKLTLPAPASAEGYQQPLGVTVDMANNVFVSDSLNNRIVELPWTGNQTGSGYATPVIVPVTGLNDAAGLAVDGAGNLWIADTKNSRVVEVRWNGTSYGNQTELSAELSQPEGVAVDGKGNVFVADTSNKRLVEVPWNGSFYDTPITNLATGLEFPKGVAVDAVGNVYIADTGNNQIVELPWNGTAFGTQITLPVTNLNQPFSLAIGGGGNLFIADTNDALVYELPWNGTAFGTQVTVPLYGQQFASSISVDGAGNLYLADGGNNDVVKLDVSDAPALSFANTNVGSTSTDSPKTVPVTNIGNAPLLFAALHGNPAYPANFPVNSADASLCAAESSLAESASCDISVDFKPTAAGALTGNVVLTDNSLNVAGVTQSIAVSGTGVAAAAPLATLAPTSLNFGNQAENSSSAAQTLTLTNSGNATLTGIVISITENSGNVKRQIRPNGTGIASSANFSATTTCGTTLAAGSNCTIAVTFSPIAEGLIQGTLNVSDNASNSPQTAALSGTGTAPAAPVATLAPNSLSFGNQAVNSSSAAQTLTLSNSGNAALTGIQIFLNENNGDLARRIRRNGIGIFPSNNYSATTTCGATLAAGSSCTIAVTFSPTTEGSIQGTLSVTDNASNSPQTASLSGTGTAPAAPAATLAPTSLAFGNQTENTSSPAKTVTLSNSGNASLTGISISLSENTDDDARRVQRKIQRKAAGVTSSNDYSATTTCGETLAAGSSCTIAVTFSPTTLGSLPGTLTVTDDASNSPQTASLSGTGTAPALPAATLAPATLKFTSTTGTASAIQTATLNNTGNAALAITSVSVTGTNAADFSQTNTCGSSLAAGATCTISVTFTPASTGSFTATLTVTDNATGSPQTSSLSGTGTAATGDFAVSSTTPSQTVTAGAAASYQIVVATTPSGDVFNNAVTLSASGLSAGATATFTPASVTPGSASASSTMTIQTVAASTQARAGSAWRIAGPSMAFLLGGFSLAFWRKRNRQALKRLSGWQGMLVLAALGLGSLAGSLGLASLTGCGGGFALPKPTPVAQTYTVTVTGTSGEDTHTTTVTLTVQ